MRSIFLSLFVVLSLVACNVNVELGDFKEQRSAAEVAVGHLRDYLKSHDFRSAYSLGSDQFKSTIPFEQFATSVAGQLETFGEVKEFRQLATSCFPYQVRFVYLTTFAKGKGTEFFVWEVRKGRASLLSYNIAPGWAAPPTTKENACP